MPILDSKISVQEEDFSLEQEQSWLLRDNQQDGAMVSFVGLVRDFNLDSSVTGLFLEHYPQMTQKTLSKIINQAADRWDIHRINVIHRVGQLHLADKIVFVGVTSPHRQSAFDACQFVMDYLKTAAPFWKKETTTNGERWIEARDSDSSAMKKWQIRDNK